MNRSNNKSNSNSKYIVDFNKKLALFHNKTIHFVDNQEVEIDDNKDFSAVKSYLNYNEDRIEFTIQINYEKLKQLKIGKKTVSYKLGNFHPIIIPIILNEKKMNNGSEMCDINIKASFKDILLHLFEFYHKEFQLKIAYTTSDGQKYATIFSVSLPKVENQTDWDPKKKFIQVYNPEDIGGFELRKVFNAHFNRHEAILPVEHEILNVLWNYREAHYDDRFENYDFLKMFQYMVAIEDLNCFKDMEDFSLSMIHIYKYNLCPVTLQNSVDQHLRHLMCDEKKKEFVQNIFIFQARKKLPVDIMDFDFCYIYNQLDYQENHDDPAELASLRKVGKIFYMFGDIVIFKFPRVGRRKQNVKLDHYSLYRIEFVPNRMTTRVTHRALDDMSKMKMEKFLKDFEESGRHKNNVKDDYFQNFKWFNPSLKDNEEQQIAVENIVNCTSFPSPFIVFGGPGTGKSSTIVEAIAQIVKLKPKSHILLAVSSNSTCDDIGNRLLKFISVNKILRIYSPIFDKKPEKIDTNLQSISNFRKRTNCACGKKSCPELDAHSDPSYEELYTARVVIVTLITAGRLVSAGIDNDHFDYIFIDEAGSVTEPQTYIPLSGLGMSYGRMHAQVVLSGDHKQLGPVVKHTFAQKMGLETSLMQRLMDTDKKYQLVNNEYDHKFVVQLKLNYRNHPAIMHFSNVNFYNEKLIPMCTDEIKSFALDPKVLLFNQDFPIIFHTTKSRSEEVGLSLKNEGELLVLLHYLIVILKSGLCGQKVEEHDIGIISPYRGQQNRMIEEITYLYPNVEIGTVDAFQGREKKIILMSCVRSGTTHVGFLRNEKRLNVALTRAQSLLIIIGNAQTLQKCSIWNKFVTYCYENKATVGDNLTVNHEAIGSVDLSGNEEVLPENGVEDEYEE